MNLIVVVDAAYGIGKDQQLLTHLPGDLKYFRQHTLNKVVVMGRKTLASLPGGKPFKDRTNVVLTRDTEFQVPDAVVVHTVEALMAYLEQFPGDEIFVVGGGEIYQLLLPLCDTAYVTHIHKTLDADTFFPDLTKLPEWQLAWSSEEQEEKGIPYTWEKYKKLLENTPSV